MSGWLVATSVAFSASYLEHNPALNSFAYWAATPNNATVFTMDQALGLATVHRGVVIPDPLGREPSSIAGHAAGLEGRATVQASGNRAVPAGSVAGDSLQAQIRDAQDNH